MSQEEKPPTELTQEDQIVEEMSGDDCIVIPKQPEVIDLRHLKPPTEEWLEARKWEQFRLALDLGCSTSPMGDVNVDLPRTPKLKRRGYTGVLRREAKKIPNFVYADWHHLPFIKGAFTAIASRHTYWWEEFYGRYSVEEAAQVLQEIMRVLGYASVFFVGEFTQFDRLKDQLRHGARAVA